jgi:hypothetical protein
VLGVLSTLALARSAPLFVALQDTSVRWRGRFRSGWWARRPS